MRFPMDHELSFCRVMLRQETQKDNENNPCRWPPFESDFKNIVVSAKVKVAKKKLYMRPQAECFSGRFRTELGEHEIFAIEDK